MRVAFMPLYPTWGGNSVIITEFPVILSRSSRVPAPPEAMTVSPNHCQIDAVDGVLVVRDLGSRHGTFVNESRVREACVWPGSKLTVGLTSFFVCYNLPQHEADPHKCGESPATGTGNFFTSRAKTVDTNDVVAFNRSHDEP